MIIQIKLLASISAQWTVCALHKNNEQQLNFIAKSFNEIFVIRVIKGMRMTCVEKSDMILKKYGDIKEV